jgi:serine/threonine protein kinase
LVPLLGQLVEHPEGKKGLVMGLIPEDYAILGNPPSLVSCTRDVFSTDAKLTTQQAVHIAMHIASVAAHLHQNGIMHGDLYAHNILINKEGHPLLTDFGAAVIYNKKDANLSHALESLEVLAYGYLLDDLCGLVGHHEVNNPAIKAIAQLSKTIIHSTVADRPSFHEIRAQLIP